MSAFFVYLLTFLLYKCTLLQFKEYSQLQDVRKPANFRRKSPKKVT